MEAALPELRAAVADQPEDAEARHNLGTVLLKLNDWEGAIAELSQAAHLDPLLAEAHVNLAQALQKAGRAEEARRATLEAQRILKVKSNQGRALVLLESAAQKIKGGERVKAIDELREAISLDENLVEAHFLLGSTLRQAPPSLEEAVQVLGGVLRLDPRHARARYELGRVLEDQGKPVEAEAEYRKSIEIAPSLVEARRALSSLAIRKDDWGTASAQLRYLLAWSPEDADAHFQLGRLLARRKEWEQALDEFKLSAKLKAGRAEVHHETGLALKALGREEEAAKEFRAARELSSGSAAPRGRETQ
jgi:tetratricopeptide (TPR) repeat protein